MDVLEQAKSLAEAIKESSSYQTYQSLKKSLYEDETIAGPLSLFEAKQANLQRMQMMGEELNPDELSDAQELFDELNKNEEVQKFFEAEFEFNKLIAEVSKILGDAMSL
jgi:cell fate (sporulation/competence/biofilm development) regulator YlbF (YheA/YmcA/DUF963 family)